MSRSNRPWFSDKSFTSLEIRRDESIADHRIMKSVTITDVPYIVHLAERIESIDPDGNMMISFAGIAEYITLTFFSEGKKQEIHIIEKRFKTPSTGFHAFSDEAKILEKALYEEIDAMLFPAVGRILPRVAGLVFDFGGFSLCYQGSRYEDHAPITLQFHINEFIFRDKKGEQLIEISSGQLPPQPYAIKGAGLTLLTFRSAEDKRIYPGFFQVIEG